MDTADPEPRKASRKEMLVVAGVTVALTGLAIGVVAIGRHYERLAQEQLRDRAAAARKIPGTVELKRATGSPQGGSSRSVTRFWVLIEDHSVERLVSCKAEYASGVEEGDTLNVFVGNGGVLVEVGRKIVEGEFGGPNHKILQMRRGRRQAERDRAEKAAAGYLQVAKNSRNRRNTVRLLELIVEDYPETQAAEEAAEMLKTLR